jgi:hypothetical protein
VDANSAETISITSSHQMSSTIENLNIQFTQILISIQSTKPLQAAQKLIKNINSNFLLFQLQLFLQDFTTKEILLPGLPKIHKRKKKVNYEAHYIHFFLHSSADFLTASGTCTKVNMKKKNRHERIFSWKNTEKHRSGI